MLTAHQPPGLSVNLADLFILKTRIHLTTQHPKIPYKSIRRVKPSFGGARANFAIGSELLFCLLPEED
jgi:hypothetical protein